jgi:ribosome-associated toxin RatA of RatAB toxin-antitoxin module
MVIVERSALVGHQAADLFRLVADVEAYPTFLPWCAASEVSRREPAEVIATLHVRYRGMRQRFTTRNAMVDGARIEMRLVDGPFRHLNGRWAFAPLAEDACRVDFRLAYELASPLLSRAIGPAFDHIANSLLDAFVRQADAVHGGA